MGRGNEVQVAAFASVMRQDDAYQYRKMMRWYCREFNEPYSHVEDLCPDDVMQAYWEDYFQQVLGDRPEGFLDQGLLLIRTPEEAQAATAAERADADDFAARVAEEEAAKTRRETLQAAAAVGKGLEAVVEALRAVGGDDDPLAGNLPRNLSMVVRK